MSYYQDRDFELYLEYEFSEERCSRKSCQGCKSYYRCNQIVDTTEIKDSYIVMASGLYLMSHKKNGKWFTKDINKARKFKKIETAIRYMMYMGVERYNII